MMASSRSGQVSDHVNAPPEAVWKLLADVERMGEWSPECYRVRRLSGATEPAREGSLFKGWNKAGPGGLLRWSFKCQVIVADADDPAEGQGSCRAPRDGAAPR